MTHLHCPCLWSIPVRQFSDPISSIYTIYRFVRQHDSWHSYISMHHRLWIHLHLGLPVQGKIKKIKNQ